MDSEILKNLCMGCMREKNTENKCTFCGFEEGVYTVSPHHLPLRTILGGKYLVGCALGEGGFGITYLGWDLNLDIKIAIKEYYPNGFVTRESTSTNTVTPYVGEKEQFFTKGRARFVDEAKSLAKFYALPGIVSVKDFFLENGTAYIVMEFVKGETLKQLLTRSGGKMPAAQVFEMMKPLMRSLSEIHKAGIIHRDISPDNIMVTPEGNVKLIDFGAARNFEDSGNKSLSVMLKPGYAPEEQYRSRGIQGPWTDVYALCTTMYRAITGVTPMESIERVQKDDVKKPSELGISIQPQKEAALMKGMAVLQENRYQSIDDLCTESYALERYNNVPSTEFKIKDDTVFKAQNTYEKEIAGNILEGKAVHAESTSESNNQTKGKKEKDINSLIGRVLGLWKCKKWIMIIPIIFLSVACITMIIFIVSMANEKNSLMVSSDSYQKQNSVIEAQYNDLKTQYDSLKTQYDNFKADNDSMGTQYSNLQAQYNSLLGNYDEYKDEYSELTNRLDAIIGGEMLVKIEKYYNDDGEGNVLDYDLDSATLKFLDFEYNIFTTDNISDYSGKNLMISIYRPDGSLMQGKSSPSDCTTHDEISGENGDHGWGNKDGGSYTTGWYFIVFKYNDKVVGSDAVYIK